ncbi:MAG: hypothetical protein KAX38_09630, partial [Candidatus Krumholzibacteria bacterium]|nr:hypothetical protein [Candidatus Krumholzibacteria bacterium]
TVTIINYGVERFRRELVDSPDNDIRLGRIFNFVIKILIPIEFLAMITWWFTQAILYYDPDFWWHPLRTFSIGTCVFQWGILIVLLLILNRPIRRLLFKRKATGSETSNSR